MSSCSAPACPVSVVGSCGSSSWLAHQLWGGCCAPRLPPAGALQTPWLQLLVHTRVLLLDAFCGASSALLLCASLFPRPSDLPARSARPFGALPSLTACAARWCRAQRSEVDVSYFRAAGAVMWLEAGLRAAHGSPRGPLGVMLLFMGSVPPPQGRTEALCQCGVAQMLILGLDLVQTGGWVLSFQRRLSNGGQASSAPAARQQNQRKWRREETAAVFLLPCPMFLPALLCSCSHEEAGERRAKWSEERGAARSDVRRNGELGQKKQQCCEFSSSHPLHRGGGG